MARIKPEYIPIKIAPKYNSKGEVKGYQTRDSQIPEIEVVFSVIDSGEYEFKCDVLGKSPWIPPKEKPIRTQEEAERFAESKLREIIQKQAS